MIILPHFKVHGITVAMIETEHTIDIEITEKISPTQDDAIRAYIAEEGILDEVLAGNSAFGEFSVDTN